MTSQYDKWDIRMLQLAQLVSTWSKDPSTKVGAVITDEKHRVISLGYNGFPSKCADHDEVYADRERKYRRILHAERNALLFTTQDLTGSICYTYPFPPCCACASMLIQAGIDRVVAIEPTKDQLKRWSEEFDEAFKMYYEAKVLLTLLPMEVLDVANKK